MCFLFIWKMQLHRGKGRGRGSGKNWQLPFGASLPKGRQWPRQRQAKARSSGLHLSLLHGSRGPRTWFTFCCFARCIDREVELRWEAGTVHGGFTCYVTELWLNVNMYTWKCIVNVSQNHTWVFTIWQKEKPDKMICLVEKEIWEKGGDKRNLVTFILHMQ